MKLIIAFVLLLLGITRVADWIIFSVKDENEALSWDDFKLKYIARFPETFQPLVGNHVLFTVLCLLCFAIAGIIFIQQNKIVYTVLGVFAFLMASWQLFSLM